MLARGAGALALVLALASGGNAFADGDCYGISLIDEGHAVAMATVAGTGPRTNFIENGGKTGGACPANNETCRRKGFVINGDKLLVQMGEGPFVCASYKTPKYIEVEGWLPRAALKIETAPQAALADWMGQWRRDKEAAIELKPKGPNGIQVTGSATYGALDPQRVKRGGVNIGSLEGVSTPRGNVLPVGEKYDGAKPPGEGQNFACKARLRLFGPYLAVEDNGNCGGNNVRFTGIYMRTSPGR